MKRLFILTIALICISFSASASEIRIARQFGINYLPLIVLEKQGILQKHLDKAGLKSTKIKWVQLGDPVAINEALISGNLDFGTTGPAPAIIIWDKTKKNIGVKAVAAINIIPMHLVTNDPKIKTIKDFTAKDKIALPGAKVSTQAIVLQIAAEKAFGKYNALDKYTVTMSHPDATSSLKSGSKAITAHFSTPPYSFDVLQNKNIHTVATSEQILGERSTGNLIFTTTKYKTKNPKEYKAFTDALNEAINFINTNKDKAAEIYASTDRAYSKEYIRKLLDNPEISFTTKPTGILPLTNFMFRAGIIKNKPHSINDLFF